MSRRRDTAECALPCGWSHFVPCASFSKGLKEQVLYLGDFEGAGGAT